MNNVFDFAAACLHRTNIDEKLALTHQAWQLLHNGELKLSPSCPPLPIEQVSFPDSPELLAPRNMPNRKLTNPQGVAAFFHAIAHVEFMAIYLAWDMLYRFRGMPEQFYMDWLQVADEEAQHFELIRTHLQALNIQYGDLPAHGGLWDHAKDTSDDLLARLAMVPRCMEARGLDVTPAIIEKFANLGDQASVTLLTRILTDEIGHVALGSKWFSVVCQQRGMEPDGTYQALITQYYIAGKPKGPFNRELRKRAGFSDVELDWLAAP
ncbi:MAG: ferritin-like domain-containing protein [Methylobacter sp.]|nr:ferritin-like domain-containing protein [Methylobacter sp.]